MHFPHEKVQATATILVAFSCQTNKDQAITLNTVLTCVLPVAFMQVCVSVCGFD